MTELKKIGPLSIDIVVACKIYEMSQKGTVFLDALAREMSNVINRQELLTILRSLTDWGIVDSRYLIIGKDGSGDRTYQLSMVSYHFIRDIYEGYWTKVLHELKGLKHEVPKVP